MILMEGPGFESRIVLSCLYSLWSRRWHDGPTFLIDYFASVAEFVQTPALVKQLNVYLERHPMSYGTNSHILYGVAPL